MLELARYPVCVLSCHTLVKDPAQPSMSDRKYSGSSTRDTSKSDRRGKNPAMRDHRHARSSADDPTISTTRSSKAVSSNARNHPRAELRDSELLHRGSRQSQGSPVGNHVSTKANGGRKRTCEVEEEDGDVWVEHTSSSGRIYYYNKKNGVSQWERPSSMSKITKTDDPHTKHTTAISSKHSSHPHSSSSHSHSSHTHSMSSSHSHKEFGSRSYTSSSHHMSHSSHHHISHSSQQHHDRARERERGGHSSHRHSKRGSRSSSKSTSVSPTTSRGRGHHDKTTPSRPSRSHGGSRRSVSPSVSSSKYSHTTSSAVALSPCTPGIPHAISESLVATQQVINQTSAIIKHQQKLLSASGDPVTLSPTSSKQASHSHARQRLLFTPTGSSHQANGPSSSQDGNNTPATPAQNNSAGVAEMSPGMENLHPLQRALLLQQQQQQATVVDIPAGQSTPGTPLPSTGGGGTPLSQAVTPPISALPHHLVSQGSYPGSPFSNSPSHTPSFFTTPPGVHIVGHPMLPGPYTPQGIPPNSQTPAYTYQMPMMIPANTPITGIYMTDGSILPSAGGGGAYVTPGSTTTMRPPMSRLGRRCSAHDEFSVFPDPGQVESVASATNPELFSRALAEATWWTQTTETLHRQLDSMQREVLSRRTTESLYLHGRLRRAQLSLDATKVRSTTRRERLLALEHLMSEIDQR